MWVMNVVLSGCCVWVVNVVLSGCCEDGGKEQHLQGFSPPLHSSCSRRYQKQSQHYPQRHENSAPCLLL